VMAVVLFVIFVGVSAFILPTVDWGYTAPEPLGGVALWSAISVGFTILASTPLSFINSPDIARYLPRSTKPSHITAATARGESTGHIVRHHVLRNASIPLVTVMATYAGYLMGGAVIVESLFTLPGLGQAVLNGVNERDYAVVQGMVLVAAAAFIAINMLADFAYGLIDPRILRAAH